MRHEIKQEVMTHRYTKKQVPRIGQGKDANTELNGQRLQTSKTIITFK